MSRPPLLGTLAGPEWYPESVPWLPCSTTKFVIFFWRWDQPFLWRLPFLPYRFKVVVDKFIKPKCHWVFFGNYCLPPFGETIETEEYSEWPQAEGRDSSLRSSLDVSWVHRLNAVTQIRRTPTLITIIKAKQSEIRPNHRSDNFWTSERYKALVIFLGRKLVHSLFMALNKFPHHAASVQRNLLCFQRINCLWARFGTCLPCLPSLQFCLPAT